MSINYSFVFEWFQDATYRSLVSLATWELLNCLERYVQCSKQGRETKLLYSLLLVKMSSLGVFGVWVYLYSIGHESSYTQEVQESLSITWLTTYPTQRGLNSTYRLHPSAENRAIVHKSTHWWKSSHQHTWHAYLDVAPSLPNPMT